MLSVNESFMPVIKQILRYREPAIWLAALCLLFFMNTDGPSLCLFRWMGYQSCPGCGLGHSMHEALHGEWRNSIKNHVLGIPAIILLLVHIGTSIYSITKTNKRLYGSKNAYDADGIATR